MYTHESEKTNNVLIIMKECLRVSERSQGTITMGTVLWAQSLKFYTSHTKETKKWKAVDLVLFVIVDSSLIEP